MEKLIAVKQLDDEKLSDLKKMAAICEDFENLRLKLNWNLLSFRTGEYTDDFLYYQDGQLIGSLHLFAFEQKTAEINGMVHPAYRQQGVFSKLLTRVQQECACNTRGTGARVGKHLHHPCMDCCLFSSSAQCTAMLRKAFKRCSVAGGA